MKNTAVVVLVGLPGSGKSSVGSLIASSLQGRMSISLLSFDDVIGEPQSCNPTQGQWKKSRNVIAECVEYLIIRRLGLTVVSRPSGECLALMDKLPHLDVDTHEDFILLLDDNFYYSSMRRPYYLLAMRYTLGFGCLVCRCPMDLCLTRNSDRINPVPDHVIIEMGRKTEWPNREANMWEAYTLEIDTSLDFTSLDISTIAEYLTTVLQHPFSDVGHLLCLRQSERDRETNRESVLHTVDVTLRSTVREVMSSADPGWRLKNANVVSNVRLSTLRSMREMLLSATSFSATTDYNKKAVGLFKEALSSALSEPH